MESKEKYFVLLSGLFTGLLVLANIIAAKIINIEIFDYSFFVPAAVFAYAFTFAITDTISEVWGKERTNWLVFTGFITALISAVLIKLAINFPAAPFWTMEEQFNAILGSNLRFTIAGLTAYLVSQYHDVWSFHFFKEKTNGKHLWLRNNLSTSISQLLDTTIFITIAFYGIVPDLWKMILSQYVIKLLIALFDTPIVYGLVYLIRKENKDSKIKIEETISAK